MYPGFLLAHSIVRYLLLILLITLIIRSLLGWVQKSSYSPLDNKISLWTLIVTHTQFLIGLVLYFFISPNVQFTGSAMSDTLIRYWTVEHIIMMIIAVALITAARSSSKKLTDGPARHRRLFILNSISLLVMLAAIAMSGRGFLGLPL